ncbi:hypothetical protein AVEN_219076-1 [Araneus ventricosus]|uniref:Uncharacterized protein n=1 Tax=Araneus ventricosus TaxID=182803 RepID=A0A4Y2GAU2_ARAVE|nr:hypothetical protein AVEN_219076-1 [Araneus ventricosus]
MLTSLQRATIQTFIEYLDGETTELASFSVNIGKQLTNCEEFPIINFDGIELDEININKTVLNKDQQYLLYIVRAIQTGQYAPDLAVRDTESVSHFLWMTCANSVLR